MRAKVSGRRASVAFVKMSARQIAELGADVVAGDQQSLVDATDRLDHGLDREGLPRRHLVQRKC